MSPSRLLHQLRHTPVHLLIVATAFAVVLLVGAIVVLVSDDLSAHDYLWLVAFAAIPAGLVAIGHGIAEEGKQRAGAIALQAAHTRGERHRPVDRETDGTTYQPDAY